MAENKVKYGLKNVHIAPITAENKNYTAEEENAYTYGEWFAYPGAVSLTGSSKSTSTKFYADDTVYSETYTDNGYDLTFESARMIDEFCEKILNEQDGRQKASNKPVAFALCGEFDGDKQKGRFIFWKCDISKRPDFTTKTNEDNGATPQTDTITATASPRVDTEDIKSVCYPDWAVYDTLYTAVPKPSEFKKPTTEASGS